MYSLGAQTTVRAHAKLIPLKGQAAEALRKRLDRSKLPEGAVTDPDSQQEFVLQASGAKDLGVVAIYFHYEPPGPNPLPPEQCGIFLVPREGNSTYIPVVGPDTKLGSPLCGGVRAVGLSNDPGPRPRLICIFNATNMHGKDYTSPWILAWDQRSGNYNLDFNISAWLWSQKTAITIPAIKLLLIQHD